MTVIMTGCNTHNSDSQLKINAKYLQKDINDLWDFNNPAWQKTSMYPFLPAGTRCPTVLSEGGVVRFLWNEDYLWIMADMKDSDIVQECDQDNRHHYQTGDVLEIFIRPARHDWYWEFYATPNGHKTVFSYPSGGRRLPSCLLPSGMPDHQIKIELHGTLNNMSDRDNGWCCIVAIPLKELREKCPLDFSIPWMVQVARYNYSVYLQKTEYSILGRTTSLDPDFHCFSSYALLYFDK